jgi:UDP-2,3-diacylglucosamine pyrophosphatase LpxH
MGRPVWSRLQELLRLDHDVLPLPRKFICDESRVLARHGHEWDPTNRYDEDHVAVGDIIVLQLLVRLPALLRAALGTTADDPRLAFLAEIDNVRPQTPFALDQWIVSGLRKCCEDWSGATEAISATLKVIVREFRSLLAELKISEAIVGRRWAAMIAAIAPRFARPLRAAKIQSISGTGETGLLEYVRSSVDFGAKSCSRRFVISGHTHVPEVRALAVTDAPVTYINTGTWKRVHALAVSADGRPSFSTWEEQCFVIVRTQKEHQDGLPAWEFHRVSRGRPVG